MHLMKVTCGSLLVGAAIASTGAAAGESADWPTYLGDAASSHYSNLEQINRDNVARLEVAWTFEAGDTFPGSELQCNPLVIDGVLYGPTASAGVVALDAATGTQRWRFDAEPGAAHSAHNPVGHRLGKTERVAHSKDHVAGLELHHGGRVRDELRDAKRHLGALR